MNIVLKDTVYWREQKSAWESSGLSQRSYCKREGLCYPKFNYHIRKLKDKGLRPAFKFIEVAHPIIETKNKEQRQVRVELPNGVAVVLELSVALSLAQVIKVAGAV